MILLDHRATKTQQEEGDIKLHYREMEDVFRLVNYVLMGTGVIYTGCRGILYNPNDTAVMVREMLRVQELYKKCAGVRIRHEFVVITGDELPARHRAQAIKEIAERFAAVYYWMGFQVVFGVVADSGRYGIHYAINTVNYHDGSKFQGGLNAYEKEHELLRTIVAEVKGAGISPDYRELEYYG